MRVLGDALLDDVFTRVGDTNILGFD